MALALCGRIALALPLPVFVAGPWQEELRLEDSINPACPRSGKPVVADSLTEYRGYTVGFCNQHCRDDFAGNVDQRPHDRSAFDAAISKLSQRSIP